MASEVKVLIACGSGIATSTVAQEKVKEILRDAKIPAKITKGTVGQLPVLQDGVDVIMLTTRYGKPLNKPVIQVFGLISGINEHALAEEVSSTCRDVRYRILRTFPRHRIPHDVRAAGSGLLPAHGWRIHDR